MSHDLAVSTITITNIKVGTRLNLLGRHQGCSRLSIKREHISLNWKYWEPVRVLVGAQCTQKVLSYYTETYMG